MVLRTQEMTRIRGFWGRLGLSLKPHGLLSSGTKFESIPIPGIFSLPGIFCIILGALLFLALIILGIQLHRWRAEHQGGP